MQTSMKLTDGLDRRIRPTHRAIEAALRGPTSIVVVVGTECAISWDDDNEQIDVSDAHEHWGFELGDMRAAIITFLQLAGHQ